MNQKNQRGITLIALVITIIVLLILAGVTISMVLGDDGIIAQAQEAKKANEESSLKDAISVAKAEAVTAQYIEQIPMDVDDLNTELGTSKEENTTVAKVEDGVPIPIGFAYVEGTKKDTGLIIVDQYGNEFVWIPVDEVKEEGDTNYTDDEVWLVHLDKDTSDAPQFNGVPTGVEDDYTKMKTSIATYGGFYVGRYETGGYNTNRVVSKAGENQASCTGQSWYTMYIMQKELHEDSQSVVSGMIYGSQWDAIMDWMSDIENPNAISPGNKYIFDSTGMGHYCHDWNWDLLPEFEESGVVPIETGSNSEYSVKNIFDLAGNFLECTMELDYQGEDRECRGGYFQDLYGAITPASHRDNFGFMASGNFYDDATSSRLQLYIK